MADRVVEQIKDLIDVADLIGESVQLVRKGNKLWGLCPFHDEKTASFSVSPERQSWHCFGCGKGGDIFTFLMEREGLTFYEALQKLAERAGVELPRRFEGHKDTRTLQDLMEKSVKFFRDELAGPGGAVGRAYLQRRGVTDLMIRTFELGWAPDAWGRLVDWAKKEGYSDDLLEKAGLGIQGNRGLYDRFRKRVMFPIRDLMGRPIAFGGRLVEGDGPKYMNSPEGPLYQKKNNLYLLHLARDEMKREKGPKNEKRAILVEGYMDALRLHSAGFSETVASLGTALTENQAKLLHRFADCCYICYDSDAAGQNATLRGMYELWKAGLEVRVVSLPEGKDPDELVSRQGGKELFEQALAEARPLVSHHLNVWESGAKTIADTEDLLHSLALLPPIMIAPHVNEICRALRIDQSVLNSELSRCRRGAPVPEGRQQCQVDVTKIDAAAQKRESALLYALWQDDEWRRGQKAHEILSLFSDEKIQGYVLSLFSGASKREMEKNWCGMGETDFETFYALGKDTIDTIGGQDSDLLPRDKYELVLRDCRTFYYRRQVAEAEDRVKKGKGSLPELMEWKRKQLEHEQSYEKKG